MIELKEFQKRRRTRSRSGSPSTTTSRRCAERARTRASSPSIRARLDHRIRQDGDPRRRRLDDLHAAADPAGRALAVEGQGRRGPDLRQPGAGRQVPPPARDLRASATWRSTTPSTSAKPRSRSIYFATVGTFNQKDKEEGSRLIFKSEIDTAEESTWEALKLRLDGDDNRRPLLLVYDEGHNLTDQQMDLLLELEPDGLDRGQRDDELPTQLGDEVKALKEEGWTDEELVTDVDAKAVADSGWSRAASSSAATRRRWRRRSTR